MSRYFVTLIAGALFIQCADANDLEQLYRTALSHDARLQAADFARAAAIEARPQARAAWLPQLSASASANRGRIGYETEQIGTVSPAGCSQNLGSDMRICYGNTQGVALNLWQTVWNYQAFNQLKAADLEAAAAEAQFREAQQALMLRVAHAYFAILSATDQLDTQRAARAAFGTLLKQAQVREQTGVGPRSDVEHAQFFYDATETGVIDALNALDDAHLALTEIVGSHADNIAPLRDSIPMTSPEPAAIDDWVAFAQQGNFLLQAAELDMQAAARDVEVQRGRGLPTLALTGSSSRLTQDKLLGGDQQLDTVGLTFNWPLFQGDAVASALRQSRAMYRQAQARYDAAQRETATQTRAAYRRVVNGVQRIAAAQRAVASGRAAVEASRRNVEFGTGSEFDLLNSQNNYYATLHTYNQARYDYLLSLLQLKQQAGRLTELDIETIDTLLVVRE